MSKIKTNSAPTPTEVVKKETLIKSPAEVKEAAEETFQTYRSGLENQKIIMQSGKTIHVRQHKYITKNPEEIEFLDYEISQGFPGLTKGEPVTTSDLDPMAALKKRMRAEIMAEIDAGNSETQKLVPASTGDLKELAGDSNSLAAPVA